MGVAAVERWVAAAKHWVAAAEALTPASWKVDLDRQHTVEEVGVDLDHQHTVEVEVALDHQHTVEVGVDLDHLQTVEEAEVASTFADQAFLLVVEAACSSTEACLKAVVAC